MYILFALLPAVAFMGVHSFMGAVLFLVPKVHGVLPLFVPPLTVAVMDIHSLMVVFLFFLHPEPVVPLRFCCHMGVVTG